MNAAILVMSSALASGGDVIPAGWGENAPPAVVQSGGCCGAPAPTVPAPCDTCCDSGRVKLLDRLKAKFGSKSAGCGCDPCAGPAYSPPNLLDRLKARCGKKDSCGCADPCPAPACPTCTAPGCAAPAVPATPVVPTTPKDAPKDMPKDMPKPKSDTDPTKKGDNGAVAPPAVIPTPVVPANPVTLPPLPVAPVSGPKLSGASSPY